MRFLKLLHQVSLDVAIGAMAYQAMFWWFRWHTFPPLVIQILLFCSVWVVYLLDRLIDSALWTIRDERHQYIKNQVSYIKILLVLLVLTNVICLFFVEKALLLQGGLLVFLMGLYWLGWVRKWYKKLLSKETFTAFLYVMGILLPFHAPFNPVFILLALLFFCVVFHHLKLFLHLAGKPSTKYLIALEAISLLILLYASVVLEVSYLVLISFAITLGVQMFIHYFYPSIRSRQLAEAAYWSPVICMLYELFSK